MSETWANFSADLLLDLGGSHRREAVERAIREAIRTGRLAGGTTLPSSRVLAAELGLARNTVAGAYAQLVAEGWLVARQGSGTRVSLQHVPAVGRPVTAKRQRARPRVDLTSGKPDLAEFPRAAWLRSARRALNRAPSELLGYPDPRGIESLRESLAGYLGRARGVRATADRIVICSGFTQAVNLLSTALRRRGAGTLAMECYGLPPHREIVLAAGLETTLIDVDRDGAVIEQLAGEDAVLLTPSHQFPLGVPLSAERRAAVIEWAGSGDRLVIEDDYDGEFRYDRRPVGALQGVAPELVTYVGTASKSLAPGLGLAWIAAPRHVLADVVEAKRLSDGHTGVFEQLTLDDLIRSGAYDRHVRRSRLRYRRRRDRLLAALESAQTPVTVSGIAAGLHAVVELPGRTAADEPGIRTRAARAGLGLTSLGEFRHRPDPQAPAALVVGYATPPEHAYGEALELLIDVLG